MKAKSKNKHLYIGLFAAFLLALVLLTPAQAIHPSKQVPVSPFSQSQVLLAQEGCIDDDDTADTRSPLDQQIPYIMSPRRTLLLSNQPKLRWNAVPGVTRYTVTLQKGDRSVWETTTRNHEVVYPGNPPLEPGAEYLLIVKADNGKSSQDETTPERGFKLLPAAEAQVLQGAVKQLNHQKVSEPTKALLRANFYIGSGLKSEAIETLEALVSRDNAEAGLYRKLGDLYWQADLTVLAENRYQAAHEVATNAQNIEEQAQAELALGKMYIKMGDRSAAIDWLTQARNSYKTLGNTQRVKELEKQLVRLDRNFLPLS